MTRQILTRLRPQGRSRRRRCSWRRHRTLGWHRCLRWHRRAGRFGGCGSAWGRSRPGHRRNWNRDGRGRRHGRGGGSGWYGLSRSRQDLTRARRRNRTSRNRTRSQRGMQRRGATCGQGRPQGRRLAAKRFFNGGNGGLLGNCALRNCRSGRSSGGSARWSGGPGGDWRTLSLWIKPRGLRPRGLFHRFRFGNCYGRFVFPARRVAFAALQSFTDNLLDAFVDGTGVGFLFGNTELGQHVDNRVRRNFELPGQLVDADFRHR